MNLEFQPPEALVVADVNGTLKDSNRAISSGMKSALAELSTHNIATTFITPTLVPDFNPLEVTYDTKMPYGVLDGAMIMQNGKVTDRGRFEEDDKQGKHELSALVGGMLGLTASDNKPLMHSVFALDENNAMVTVDVSNLDEEKLKKIQKPITDTFKMFAPAMIGAVPRPEAQAEFDAIQEGYMQKANEQASVQMRNGLVMATPKGWTKEHAAQLIAEKVGVVDIHPDGKKTYQRVHPLGDEQDVNDLLKYNNSLGKGVLVTQQPQNYPVYETAKNPRDLATRLRAKVTEWKASAHAVKRTLERPNKSEVVKVTSVTHVEDVPQKDHPVHEETTVVHAETHGHH